MKNTTPPHLSTGLNGTGYGYGLRVTGYGYVVDRYLRAACVRACVRRRECRREREIEIEKEMLEPRGGLWSSGSVTDEWNNQRKRGCGSGGGSGRGGGEVMVVVR